MAKKKRRLEYRYYEMPSGHYVLPLLGKGWEQVYGNGQRETLHFHNYLEIGYCYNGDGELIIEDRVYPYRDGMFSVIPANIPHTTNSMGGHICKWEFLFIDIEGFIRNEMRMDVMQERAALAIINRRGTLKSVQNHAVMSDLILNIIRECREEPIYYTESIKGYLYALVIEIMRLADEREKSLHTRRVSLYIRNALDYIEAHYAEPLRVEDIAMASGLSESHFRRVFEEATNMKPLDYVNLVRIDRACAMIRKEDISMEEIGFRVGYQTQSTFNRNFKRLTGCSPHQWKKDGHDHGMKNYRISALKGWEV